MSTTKITQKMFFNAVKSFIGEGEQVILDGITYTADMVNEFLDGQIEKLDKKNSHKSKADLEKAEKSDKLANEIYEILKSENIEFSASQIALTVSDRWNEFISSQRVTPQLTKMVKSGMVEKITAKGKTTYRIA
jgi:hypothetical protein